MIGRSGKCNDPLPTTLFDDDDDNNDDCDILADGLPLRHDQTAKKIQLKLGMLNPFFSKFEFQPLKFGLNSNFVYIFVEKLKQFAFDVCTVGRDEDHSTHATRQEAVYQQCNQPGRQAMSRSIAVRLMSALCLGHQDL